MDRLKWIEGDAAQGAVDIFQHEMELLILALLQDEPDHGIAKLKSARDNTINNVKNMGFDFIPMDQEVKSTGLALELLNYSFYRMLRFAEAMNSDEA